MQDDQEPGGPVTEENRGAGQPRGFMVPVAIILIAILVLLVISMNMAGQGATDATAITENPWSLQSAAGPDGTITPVPAGAAITAGFSTTGQLTGSGGCSQYSARYMVQETLIVISRVTETSVACTNNNTTLPEARYYTLFEDAAALRVHDRVLTLYDAGGKPLLVFTPAQPRN
jgi:heat shock protein HslJ